MKNLSLALNVILILAVGILFYLHFSSNKSEAPVTLSVPVKGSSAQTIAYVNSDTLLTKYEYFKNMKTEFEGKQARLESDLTRRAENLRNEAASYQQKAATMTENELRELQEKFARKEQELMQYKDKKIREVEEEQKKQNEALYKKVTVFLQKHSQNKFKYVLGNSKDGSILYADSTLDITKQVIEGLNKEYKEEKKSK